jgi:hypothetical protein
MDFGQGNDIMFSPTSMSEFVDMMSQKANIAAAAWIVSSSEIRNTFTGKRLDNSSMHHFG